MEVVETVVVVEVVVVIVVVSITTSAPPTSVTLPLRGTGGAPQGMRSTMEEGDGIMQNFNQKLNLIKLVK